MKETKRNVGRKLKYLIETNRLFVIMMRMLIMILLSSCKKKKKTSLGKMY